MTPTPSSTAPSNSSAPSSSQHTNRPSELPPSSATCHLGMAVLGLIMTMIFDRFTHPQILAFPLIFGAFLSETHDAGYLAHLRSAHEDWVRDGLIKQHESILPECFVFPTRSLPSDGPASGFPSNPPRDIFARAGYYAFDMSSGITADTYRSAIASAGLAMEGVRLPTSSQPSEAASETPFPSGLVTAAINDVFALTRPPGHHCDTHRAGGYCYLNNAVIAVRAFQDLSDQPDARIGILDLDFHHGNGTQEHYFNKASKGDHVMYVSIHGEGEFPYYSGSEEELRLVTVSQQNPAEGKGGSEPPQKRNMNINLPLAGQSPASAYLQRLDEALHLLVHFNPQFLILSLGFDTFHLDPLGSFKIDVEDYRDIATRVRTRLSEMPALVLLEGGYVVERLGECLVAFLEGWEGSTGEEG